MSARPHLAWRFLPEAMRVSRFAIYVLGDVVAVMSTEAPDLVGIQIANANLASNFGAIFEGLWTIASDEEAPPTKPRRRRR